MPETDEFLPSPSTRLGGGGGGGGGIGGWFGWGANSRNKRKERQDEREQERVSGRVKRTRRMQPDERGWWGGEAAASHAADQGVDGGATRAGPSKSQRASAAHAAEPLHEPLD